MSNKLKKIEIVGLPNTGKSQVFTNLTGQYTTISNYPFTTLELKREKCIIEDQEYEVIDTPGMHCLYIHSEEELVVRDVLLNEKPDIIIQCIDANRLKQSLILTIDLIELGIPFVISLNAIDETTKKGLIIDTSELSKFLGVTVIEHIAINGIGTDSLKSSISKANLGKISLKYGDIIENFIERIVIILPKRIENKRKIAILLLMNDPFIEDYLKSKIDNDIIVHIRQELKNIIRQYKGNIGRFISNKKNYLILNIISKVVIHKKLCFKTIAHSLANLSRHPIFGIPILLFILLIIFYSVVNVANVIAEWMNNTFWVPVEEHINTYITSTFWNEFLIGDYGFLTFGLSNAILTVLPILTIFFLLFNTLEDIGYLPNLCVLLKKISEKFGLSGDAILPITLGFGCKTMATLTTKRLRSSKERYISIYLIAFALPCAPQMALNMSILGRMGIGAFIITFLVLASVEILAGYLLNKIIKEDTKPQFIQALPDIRLPSIKAVIKKTYYRLYWFLKEAIPIFLISAVFLFSIDKMGILDFIKNALRPIIIGFLGFPIEMVDVLILCMARQEAAAAMIIRLIHHGYLNYIQCIVAVTITTMFVPCLANIIAMIKELGFKKGIVMLLLINSTSILIAGILNWVLIFTIG